jgi:putative ABC transport system substrate-binding protein
VKRRAFMSLLGSAAAAWPLAARAQQAAMPVVGFLSSTLPGPYASMVTAFRQGLKEVGYVEGQNVAIEFRWAENELSRLPILTADLIDRRVAAVVTSGGYASTHAAKAATATIPVVFVSSGDPVSAGLVASINQPGGNITGVNFFTTELGAKRLEVLRDIVPKAKTVAILIDPRSPEAEASLNAIETAIKASGQQPVIVNAGTMAEIETAFATFVRARADALLVISAPLFTSRRDQVVALAARHSIPAIYSLREFPAAGGLISYGASITEAYRQAGVYVGRILKGANPTDLPVLQPTKFELVINLKTAKALGLTVPLIMQMTADEVIE